MDFSSIIRKSAANLRLAPKLADYGKERWGFSWQAVARELGVQPDGGLNIAWQAADRLTTGSLCDKTAYRLPRETGIRKLGPAQRPQGET